MMKRLETWAAAAAMAEGGCHDEAIRLTREVQALQRRRGHKLVVEVGKDVTGQHVEQLESMMRRFPADVLLACMGAVPAELLERLQASLANGRHVALVRLEAAAGTQLRRLLRSIHPIQWAICVGRETSLHAQPCSFPVFRL